MQERLALAGSGAIACGLASTAARHGPVLLWARSGRSADRARGTVQTLCGRLSGRVNAAHVEVVTDLEALSKGTFLIEAIAEDAEAKSELLAQIGALAGDAAVLGTTTSSLSVSELARASGRPERFVALHVFNPVAKMRLVELAFSSEASTDTRRRAVALCKWLGKTPIEVPDLPGFVVNRLLFPYLFGAVRLLAETGMTPQDLDDCMVLGAGHPMGPLALLDMVGLDVAIAIGEAIGEPVPETLRRLAGEGALGRKSGRGFHLY
ncbi:MAG: 3-hydroxyacyl-CoA dehydrogenase family protein [Actinobacteria bacterium]|nr:MAG: 3-hydroxyacyl-CoA dehydrogenase family protein [Actinomycetota bacterium]